MRVLLLLLLALELGSVVAARHFAVQNNSFFLDGAPFQIRSGSIHYARVPSVFWKDRLLRLRALGLNAIQTLIPWSWHEETEGVYDFTGDRDLVRFLETAQEVGMLVLLRVGPYICAEWDYGGIPAWIMAHNVTIRTYDTQYIEHVDRFFSVLYRRVKPLLYSNGGPVVMVQLENEFGSYGDVSTVPADKKYMEHLVAVTRRWLGDDVVLYTTDGGDRSYMIRGSLNGTAVVTLGDHGPEGFEHSCTAQAEFNPPGFNPCMDTEYYTGGHTHWGEGMLNTSTADVATYLDVALGKGYSFNLFMAFGGTTFGKWAGANGDGKTYYPIITSYDYDAPISENGDHGYGSDGKDKYAAIRHVVSKYAKQGDIPPEPPIPPRAGYGKIELTHRAEVEVSVLSGSPHRDTAPRPMEVYGEYYGLIKYSTKAARSGTTLEIEGYPRDRAQVFVNGKLQGTIYRLTAQPLKVSIQAGATVDILVEAMGRLNYGRGMMADNKGIATPVTLDGEPLGTAWEVYPIPLNYTRMKQLKYTENTGCAQRDGPAFYKGMLTVAGTPAETYVRTDGFGKGNVWVNGVNLGRYWEEMGPQHGLFVPSSFLREGENEIVVLEMDKVPAGCTAQSVRDPIFTVGTHRRQV